MLCLGSIILLTFGLLSLFAKDIMWELTAWGNKINGIASERTDTWDTMTSISGVALVIMGLILLYAFFTSG